MSSPVSEAVRHLQMAVLRRHGVGLTDGQLLACFVEQGDTTAFEAIVRRHGPMVWGVCRRVTHDHHDAEDAFQATFLVLNRKAASIAPREKVANWLHGVAYRTALKARAMASRRKAREKQVTGRHEPAMTEQNLWYDVQPLLDEELNRLPDKYRTVLVLCELQGKTRKEAARQLGCPEGSVAGWLARARSLLADRLARRGIGVSGAALAVLISQDGGSGAVPASVVSSTIKAATLVAVGQATTAGVISSNVVALTEGMVKAMLLGKLKSNTLVVLLVCGLVVGGSVLTHHALAEKPSGSSTKQGQDDKEDKEVQGVVKVVDSSANTITLHENKLVGEMTYKTAKDVKVLIDDGTGRKTGFWEGKLADVREGAVATIRLSAEKLAVLIYVEGPAVVGLLTSVDGKARTVTVTLADPKTKETTDKTFAVSKNAGVAIDGMGPQEKKSNYKLANLTAGSAVTLKLSGDQKVVGQISARGQSCKGIVKAGAENKNSITVELLDGKETKEKTFAVSRDATVLSDDGKGKKTSLREIKLAALKPGAVVTLRLSLDQKAVAAIQVETSTVHAILTAVDAQKNTVTVTIDRKGEQPQKKTYRVTKGASVQVDGQDAKLVDLPTESYVTLRLPGNQVEEASSIHAEGFAVNGTVKGNAENDSITIGNKNDDQTYTVGKGAKIQVGGKSGKLSDLIDGSVVLSARTSADKKQLLGTITAEGPSFKGIIKSVETDKITLTIGSKNGQGGEDKEFKVTKETLVLTEMNGVARKLADLKSDGEVILRLTIDQKSAETIIVLGE